MSLAICRASATPHPAQVPVAGSLAYQGSDGVTPSRNALRWRIPSQVEPGDWARAGVASRPPAAAARPRWRSARRRTFIADLRARTEARLERRGGRGKGRAPVLRREAPPAAGQPPRDARPGPATDHRVAHLPG